eukprot:3207900-Prymnesium_polylepis.1
MLFHSLQPLTLTWSTLTHAFSFTSGPLTLTWSTWSAVCSLTSLGPISLRLSTEYGFKKAATGTARPTCRSPEGG